jgi:hypothetical protein
MPIPASSRAKPADTAKNSVRKRGLRDGTAHHGGKPLELRYQLWLLGGDLCAHCIVKWRRTRLRNGTRRTHQGLPEVDRSGYVIVDDLTP